jgi:hypothetical protein
VRGSGATPVISRQIAKTRRIHASSGSVHTASRSENTSISTPVPSSPASRARSAAWSMPGTVRMSTPIAALSGTRFTPLPPSKVPTFSVGPPITGCGATPKSNAASCAVARTAL